MKRYIRVIAIAAFLAMAIIAGGCGDTIVRDGGGNDGNLVVPPGADGAIAATPQGNSSDYLIKFNWNPAPATSRAVVPLIASPSTQTMAMVKLDEEGNVVQRQSMPAPRQIPVEVSVENDGRATHPNTMALKAWIEGEWIPDGSTSNYKSTVMTVVRASGTSTIIFSGIPNGPGLKILFDEYSDASATVRVKKLTTIRLQEVPAGGSAWAATINLGGTWLDIPSAMSEAIELTFDGDWTEWQVIAKTASSVSPDYDLNTSGTQGLESAYWRFYNSTRQRVTMQIEAVQMSASVTNEMTWYDGGGTAITAAASFISEAGGTTAQPGDNPLSTKLGLNKQSDEVNPGIYWGMAELGTTVSLTTFRVKVGRGTITFGGGI